MRGRTLVAVDYLASLIVSVGSIPMSAIGIFLLAHLHQHLNADKVFITVARPIITDCCQSCCWCTRLHKTTPPLIG
ncbi:hypothetical protein F4810DRAFT_675157 [Camillea tinctor]|nr:hypothetical protein F4810DRAFT_675157 [Camillea tinctor]